MKCSANVILSGNQFGDISCFSNGIKIQPLKNEGQNKNSIIIWYSQWKVNTLNVVFSKEK